MAYRGTVRQWDIFRADLEYVVGSEQGGGRRPVIVVSNDGRGRRRRRGLVVLRCVIRGTIMPLIMVN